MNRIISYELCCKGSWTILYNLFINKQHSFLPSKSPIQTFRGEFAELFANYNDSLDLTASLIRTPTYFIGKRYHFLVMSLYKYCRILTLGILKSSYARPLSRVLLNTKKHDMLATDVMLVMSRKGSQPISRTLLQNQQALELDYQLYGSMDESFSFPGFSLNPSLFSADHCMYSENQITTNDPTLIQITKDCLLKPQTANTSTLRKRTRPLPSQNIHLPNTSNEIEMKQLSPEKEKHKESAKMSIQDFSQLLHPKESIKVTQVDGDERIDITPIARDDSNRKRSIRMTKIKDYVFCGDIDNVYTQLLSVIDMNRLFHQSDCIICVSLFCESPSESVINVLLTLPIILYVFDQSPFYKRSYINPNRESVSFYFGKHVTQYFDIPEDYLKSNIPKVVRLLHADRIVIGTYTSPDRLEVASQRDIQL